MKHLSSLLPTLLAGIALFTGTPAAKAVPAYPHPITITQSDGTQLTVRLIGDERMHYILSSDGYSLTAGADGDLYYAERSASGQLVPTSVKARPYQKLTADERKVIARLPKGLKPTAVTRMQQFGRRVGAASPARINGTKITPPERISVAQTTGKLKSLVLLVEFADQSFTISNPQQAFQDMLMQDGYSVNGATGSAWNYYQDNSNGLFDPDFVVVGPYKASRESAYYAGSNGTENVAELIVETCTRADADIDFTQLADDGVIRNVFVFYAGMNQAETGIKSLIWPHQWELSYDPRYSHVTFDGVQLAGYACSSELNGSGKISGIGAFCHEFGHVLGWPDLYDTDGTGSGGTADGVEKYSLMDAGNYNNESRTPPALGILERWMVGWAEPVELTEAGTYTLGPVCENNGFLIRTGTDNEYFLLEYRGTNKTIWDRPQDLAYPSRPAWYSPGMLVFHVDYTRPRQELWDSAHDAVNTNPFHECYKAVRSDVNGKIFLPAECFFPGGKNITSLYGNSNELFKAWDNTLPNLEIAKIETASDHAVLQIGSVSDLKTTLYEHDALLTWKDPAFKSWKVTWSAGEMPSNTQTVATPAIQLGQLDAETTYDVVITPQADGYRDIPHVYSLTTPAESGKLPRMGLSEAVYSSQNPILLSLIGSESGKMEWTVDGQPTKTNYVTLQPGEHRITAEITDKDGTKEYFFKYITIE